MSANFVQWTSPSGKTFDLKISGNTSSNRKRIGEVRNNPGRSVGEGNNKKSYKIINSSEDTFQDRGVSGRDIPLTIYFTGENHIAASDEFEMYFCEKGKSKLQLVPGNLITVQAMDIKMERDSIKSASLTTVSVTFHECGPTVYPTSKISKLSSVKNDLVEMNSVLSENFQEVVDTVEDKESLLSKWTSNLETLTGAFSDIQDSAFLGILSDIASQNLLNNPLVMASQLGILLQTGLLTFQKGKGVLDQVNTIIKNFTPGYTSRSDYLVNDLYAKSTILAAAQVLNETEFVTRKEAVEAIESLVEINESYVDYSQEKEQEINVVLSETVISAVDTTGLVNEVIASIFEKSENLKIEKTVVLTEVSNPILVASQYYPEMFKKSPEDALDYLAQTNDFSFDDFLILDKGREIIIYV